MKPTASPRADSPGGIGIESAIRLGGLLFALLVAAATLAHVLSLERTIESEVEGRARTLSRILAKEVNRTFASIQSGIDQIDEPLRTALGDATPEAAQTVLESALRANSLIRELAVVAADGQVIASSRRRERALRLTGLDFQTHARDGRLRLGLPTEGRTITDGKTPRQGQAYARQGYLTLTRSLGAGETSAQIVAILGADSLLNELRFVAADDTEVLSVFRYDGQLLATSATLVLERNSPQPIFRQFLPHRETGQFIDTLGDGSRWLAHFETTADFPAVVEVRIARASLTERRWREFSVPLLVMTSILIAVYFYTRLALRALKRRRLFEERAASQERRLRNILANAADGIVTIDAQGVVRDFNQAAERIFGVSAAEAIGRTFDEVMPASNAGGHQANVMRYLGTGKSSVMGRGRTMKAVRRDGQPIEVHLAVSEVVDQGERLFTGIVRDITETRQAEERFKTLFERSGEPHLLFDDNGLVDCNQAALALLGVAERAAVIGRPLADLAGDDGLASSLSIETAVRDARRDGSRRLETQARRPDGTAVPVEMTITPIRLTGRDALLVAWHDVADRQRYEAELRRARDEAQSAARTKASFLAMMSHELRTPLTGVIGMSELLADTRLDDEQRRLVGVLHGSATSLLTVVNDVLDFSKIEAGKLTLEAIPFDPAGVARDVVDLLSSAASGRGNLLIADWPAGTLPHLLGDPTRLRQILYNLVGNAIKFTEGGRITLSIQAQPVPGGQCRMRFAVSDTGIGIAADVLPTLFTPFRQADSTTTRRFGGTGLGLAICRHLVNAMNGQIEARSLPGEGSTFEFWIELPVVAGALPAPADAAPAAVSTTPQGLSILLAEDNPTNQLLLATRLRRAGHRVDIVDNGLKAVERLSEGEPGYDIVLMDMQMPVLDGASATRAIRGLPGARGRIPVLALTADALPESRQRYMDAGLTDYLTKPVNWAALEGALARHTRTAREAGNAMTHAVPANAVTDAPAPSSSGRVQSAAPAAAADVDPARILAADADKVDATRIDLGDDAFQEIANIFWNKCATDLAACRDAAERQDLAALRAAAHSLKGASGSLGFEALAALVDRLQHLPPDTALGLIEALERIAAHLRSHYQPERATSAGW